MWKHVSCQRASNRNFSFHHVGAGDRTEVLRFSSRCLYPTSHLPSPSVFCEKWSHCASKIGCNFLCSSCLYLPSARVITVCHQDQYSVLNSYVPEKKLCWESDLTFLGMLRILPLNYLPSPHEIDSKTGVYASVHLRGQRITVYLILLFHLYVGSRD